MEENKYYIPETSDFYEGFQYEILINTYSPPNFTLSKSEWVKETFDDITSEENYRLNRILLDKAIRVPYLTKEDIESNGWEPCGNYWTKNNIFIDGEGDYEGYEYRLFYNFKTHSLYIEKLHVREDTGEPYYDLYEGNQNHILKSATCRCKNDFKLIMKLLNIK